MENLLSFEFVKKNYLSFNDALSGVYNNIPSNNCGWKLNPAQSSQFDKKRKIKKRREIEKNEKISLHYLEYRN